MLPTYTSKVNMIEIIIIGLILVTSERTFSISIQMSVVKVILTMLTNDWSN